MNKFGPGGAALDDEKSFIRAILADPDDERILMIFADWLEERGDPRGEYLRIRAALAAPPKSRPPRRRELQDRLQALQAIIVPGWLPLLNREGSREKDRLLIIGEKGWWVRSVQDIRQRLAKAGKKKAFFLELIWNPDGESAFKVYVCGDRACVSVFNLDQEESERSLNPAYQGPARATHTFPSEDGEPTDIHCCWTIPREDALLAMEYHFTYFGDENDHYEFAPWVTWEEYPDCPLGRMPNRFRRYKRRAEADDGDGA
jgi:uncharacterized protein (TIGR02996 family)